MRLIKLAVRSVLEWRRSVSPSVATIVLVSALITFAGSVHEPITRAVRAYYRINLGEYEKQMTSESADRLTRSASSADALVSITSVPAAGALDSIADLLLVRTVFVADLVSELAFRGLAGSLPDEARETLSAGDAVLLADGPEAHDLNGRIARLSTAGRPVLTQILAVGPMPEGGPEILVLAPDLGDPVRVRLRGASRALDAAALEAALGEIAAGDEVAAGGDFATGTGVATHDALVATVWRERATERTATLTRGVRTLVFVLASLAIATLVPAHLLLVARAAPSLRLLFAWGFTPRDRAMLLLTMGGFAALVAAAFGAGIGLAVASIMNAGETSAIDLLPLELADSLGIAADTMLGRVTPAVGWAAVGVLASTLLGVLTALPSARIAATLTTRRDSWHW